MLTVLEETEEPEECPKSWNSMRLWLCKCDCGNTRIVPTSHLTSDKVYSCGCESRRSEAAKGPRKDPEEVYTTKLYYDYKSNALSSDRKFELSREELYEMSQKPCHYCGEVKTQKKDKKEIEGIFKYNGIDRIDNSEGYTKENCVTACKKCNYKKRTDSKEEFLDWIQKVYKNSVE